MSDIYLQHGDTPAVKSGTSLLKRIVNGRSYKQLQKYAEALGVSYGTWSGGTDTRIAYAIGVKLGIIAPPIDGDIDKTSVLRDIETIHKTHDLLAAINLGEIDLGLSEQDMHGLHIANDVLCWVLSHAHNPTFDDVLDTLKERMKERGIEQIRIMGGDGSQTSIGNPRKGML